MSKRTFLLSISAVASLVLLGLSFLFFDWRRAIEILEDFSLWRFTVFFLLSFLTFFLHVVRHKIILNHYHQRVAVSKLFVARLISFFVSYLIPSATLAGEPLRGYVLVKAGIDSRVSYASVILDKFWELAPNFIFMVSFLVLAMLGVKASFGLILVILGVSAFYLAIFYIFYSRAIKGKGIFIDLFRFLRIGRIFKRTSGFEAAILETEEEVTSFLKKKSKEFFQVLFLSPVIFLAWVAEVWLLAYFMGIKLNFFEVAMVQFFMGLVTIMPTSGGVGILEFGNAGIFSLFGLQGSEGLTFSLLMRIKDIIFVFGGLFYFFRFHLQLGAVKPVSGRKGTIHPE